MNAILAWLKEHLWGPLVEAGQHWSKDDGAILAAATAYYAIFSLLPLLLILIAIFGFVLRFSSGVQDARAELLEVVAKNTSPAVAENLETVLAQVSSSAVIGGPLGLLALLVAAIGIFVQFETAFDRIWNVSAPKRGLLGSIRSVFVDRLRAFLMLLGVGALVVAAFFAGVALTAVRSYMVEWRDGVPLWGTLQFGVDAALHWGIFAVIYKVLPKADVRWADAARGGLLVAVLWQITRDLLMAFLVGGKYSAYGVVGSLIALMLWAYVAAALIYYGAEYVQVLDRNRRRSPAS